MLSPTEFETNGEVHKTPAAGNDWLNSWRAAKASDIAMVMIGPWEVGNIKPPGGNEFMVLGDAQLDAAIEQRLEAGVEALSTHSKLVVLTTSPLVEPGRINGRSPPVAAASSDPARMKRLNEIITTVAERHRSVALIDLAAYLDNPVRDRHMRPDGIHLTPDTAIEFSNTLAPTLTWLAAPNGKPAPAGPDRVTVLKQPG